MFAYNAGGVTDRSGELIAQGANNAAMLQMEAMGNVGENIGSALAMFADAYKQKEQDKSDAKIYGQLMKVIAPAFGQNGDAVLAEYNSFKNDRDKANFGRTMVGSLGVIGNMYAQTRNAGIRQQGQQIQQNAPIRRAQVNAAAQAAAGQQRMTTLPSGINPDAIP